MTNKKLNYPAIAKEMASLTGGRCHYCGGGLFFSGAQSYIRQQYFRPWHRAF